MADRLFLDANVLYSAAYRSTSRLRAIWELGHVELLTSEYAAAEAWRNLANDHAEHLSELERLLQAVDVVPDQAEHDLPEHVSMADKDRPILLAASHAHATHLLTGDKAHFSHLFGQTVAGVLVLLPSEYFKAREGASS